MTRFNNCDFYSTDKDCDAFYHTSPIDALFECAEYREEDDLEPITVYGFSRAKFDHEALSHRATEAMLEFLREYMMEQEELGDPDGEMTCPRRDAVITLRPRLKALVKTALEDSLVWNCQQVAEREYSVEEIKAELDE